MKTFEELLKYLYVKLEEQNTVIICNCCNGLGSYVTQNEIGRDEYISSRIECKQCKGDGRLITTTRTISMNPETISTITPYVDFCGDKFKNTREEYKIKIDKRNHLAEQKYPELKSLTYDNYDKMLNEIKITEALEKYENKSD